MCPPGHVPSLPPEHGRKNSGNAPRAYGAEKGRGNPPRLCAYGYGASTKRARPSAGKVLPLGDEKAHMFSGAVGKSSHSARAAAPKQGGTAGNALSENMRPRRDSVGAARSGASGTPLSRPKLSKINALYPLKISVFSFLQRLPPAVQPTPQDTARTNVVQNRFSARLQGENFHLSSLIVKT